MKTIHFDSADYPQKCDGCQAHIPAGKPHLNGIEGCCGECCRVLCWDCCCFVAMGLMKFQAKLIAGLAVRLGMKEDWTGDLRLQGCEPATGYAFVILCEAGEILGSPNTPTQVIEAAEAGKLRLIGRNLVVVE